MALRTGSGGAPDTDSVGAVHRRQQQIAARSVGDVDAQAVCHEDCRPLLPKSPAHDGNLHNDRIVHSEEETAKIEALYPGNR